MFTANACPSIPAVRPRPEPPSVAGLYDMIPTAVRSRIPRTSKIPVLNILRRPRTVPQTPAERSRSSSLSSSSTEGSDIVGGGRQPSSRPSTPGSDPSELVVTGGGALVPFDRAVPCADTAIDKALADIGYQLCTMARQERYSHAPNEARIRRMHIDAICYLSMALPKDLNLAEVSHVRENMPLAILENSGHAPSSSAPRPSMLRRLTAWGAALLFGWAFLLLPLLLATLNAMLRYERRHRLTESGLSFLQGTFVGVTAQLTEKQVDAPAYGGAFGRVIAGVSVCTAGILKEIVSGVEEGWDRASLTVPAQVADP